MSEQPSPSPQPEKLLKPVETTQVFLALLSLVKEIGALVALAMMEWARIKQKKAENKAAVAETELKVLKHKVEVEKAHAKKDPRAVIDDFLAGPDGKE